MSTISSEQFNTTGIRVKPGACVVIISTDWNTDIVDELEKGARKILEQFPLKIVSIRVPGAVELGFAVKRFWDVHQLGENHPSAFIVFGCIIQGDTPHFDYVSHSVTTAVTHLNLTLPVPTIFGVLTVNNHMQAVERIGGRAGHKGTEAAVTALRMMQLDDSFDI